MTPPASGLWRQRSRPQRLPRGSSVPAEEEADGGFIVLAAELLLLPGYLSCVTSASVNTSAELQGVRSMDPVLHTDHLIASP